MWGALPAKPDGKVRSRLPMNMKLPRFQRRQQPSRDQKPAMRRKRGATFRIVLFLCVLTAIGGGFFAWRSQQSAAAAAPSINVPVIKGDLDITVENSGKVQPSRNVAVTSGASGLVTEVLVSAGDKVTKGQPLVRLDDHELQLSVEKAEANLKSAQAKVD